MNCTRPNEQSIERASALARLVLPTPGTSSMSRWPSETRHSRTRSITSALPWMTFWMLREMAPNSSANEPRGSAVSCVAKDRLSSDGRSVRAGAVRRWRRRSLRSDRLGRGRDRPVGRRRWLASAPERPTCVARHGADGRRVVLAVDIGGTKLAAGLVDRRRHGPRPPAACPPRPPTRDGEQLFAALIDAGAPRCARASRRSGRRRTRSCAASAPAAR